MIRSLKDFRKNEIWFDERFAPATALEVTGNIVVRTKAGVIRGHKGDFIIEGHNGKMYYLERTPLGEVTDE